MLEKLAEDKRASLFFCIANGEEIFFLFELNLDSSNLTL